MVKVNKKSQSEIMGLAMVMVLIVVGLLIFISISMRTTRTSLTNEFNYKQLPVLLNKAIFETHLTEEACYGEKVQTLLKTAEGAPFVCSNGQMSGVVAEEFITDILNKTLNEWGMEYIYSVYTDQDFTVCNLNVGSNADRNGNCVMVITNSLDRCFMKDISTENFFFRMNTGQLLNIKLDICS